MKPGEKIKEIRESKGITQKALAKSAGIMPSTLGKYERGVLNPKIETVEKIAKALDCHVLDIIDIEFFGKADINEKQKFLEIAMLEAYMHSRKEHFVVKAAGYTWISPQINDRLIHLINNATNTEYTVEENLFFNAINESLNFIEYNFSRLMDTASVVNNAETMAKQPELIKNGEPTK